MENCLFCKIINNEIPSWTVYEDEHVKAFLDINPANEGHTLIVPKNHHDDIFSIPKKELDIVMEVTQRLAKKYTKQLGATGVNLIHPSGKDAQQDVFHFHMHLIPRYQDDSVNIKYELNLSVREFFDATLNKIQGKE